MNNSRRSELKAIRADIKALMRRLSDVKDVEEDILANMPEKVQFSAKGEAYENRINSMIAAGQYLDDAIREIDEAAA